MFFKVNIILIFMITIAGCVGLKQQAKSAEKACREIYPKDTYIVNVCILGVSIARNNSNKMYIKSYGDKRFDIDLGLLINKAHYSCNNIVYLGVEWRKVNSSHYAACYRGIKLFLNEVVTNIGNDELHHVYYDSSRHAIFSLNAAIKKADHSNPINIKGYGNLLDCWLGLLACNN
jgi:hypothetical protein